MSIWECECHLKKNKKCSCVAVKDTLSHTASLCVWVETDCVSASLPLLWWLFCVWEGRPLFIGWIKSSFICSILIEGVCYLFWPLPLSLTHTHTFLYTVLQRARHQSKVFGMRQRCWQICDCLLACVRVCARACTLANHLVMSLYTCPCSLYLIQTRGSVDLRLPSPCPQACSHWLIFKLSILGFFCFF